jgi:hypothetical protein
MGFQVDAMEFVEIIAWIAEPSPPVRIMLFPKAKNRGSPVLSNLNSGEFSP